MTDTLRQIRSTNFSQSFTKSTTFISTICMRFKPFKDRINFAMNVIAMSFLDPIHFSFWHTQFSAQFMPFFTNFFSHNLVDSMLVLLKRTLNLNRWYWLLYTKRSLKLDVAVATFLSYIV